MVRLYFVVVLLLVIMAGCRSQESVAALNYPENVGDVVFDATMDTADFSPCRREVIGQNYEFGGGLMFENEKPALLQHFESLPSNDKNYQGYIVVRFVVNCQGQTGWFRIQTIDFDLKEVDNAGRLPHDLITIIKKSKGWGVPSDGRTQFDYYQYLTFKIINGQVKEILP